MNLARNGYTHEQVKEMLHMVHGSSEVRFRYNLLDKNDNFIGELDQVQGGDIEFSSFSNINRTAKIKLIEDSYTQEILMTWADLAGKTWGDL